ncbi:MAG: lipoyl(octanoyl) transferase LipB [Rhodospirillales bacterium]|jgi:lipoyl(octanoyl) transferase|nr:lipoyl(octanoyl) transferase LipB [Rhodospirillales bacterium]
MQTPDLIEWRTDAEPVEYEAAVSFMEDRVEGIRTHNAPETVWLLEHPPLYTAGTSATPDDLLEPGRFPVHRTGRGGQYTYHGPGQRVGYVMLDLNVRGRDVRAYVHNLEEWIIATLAKFDMKGERRDDRVGIWIDQGGGVENKIAAIGVRIRRWITFHGIAINVNPDLDHFTGIVPCGINAHGVTSLHALGVTATMDEVDAALRGAFDEVFRG